ATLGFHWVYNPDYLEELSKKQSLLFSKQLKHHFDLAKPSYFVYPHAEVGTFSTQGYMLKWLYHALLNNNDLTRDDYENLIYDRIKPGGSYEGYIESYTKKLIIKKLANEVHLDVSSYPKDDDHLVGFIPYLACKEIGLSIEKAFELAQAFTTRDAYYAYYKMFDYIFEHLKKKSLRDLLKEAIKLAPLENQEQLKQAIELDDTKIFIQSYAGIACQINQSIPLIIHMLSHCDDYEMMMHWNAKIGGASSDRGLLLGAVLSQISSVPKAWKDLTKL
ncbi:MAG: ADP-ribosylglycohydrolase family protein, partial [Acholeplasmataceae bacterium]|nr:ADP-ribosylglycohydrolase family protein [Acholeplasmataceae bacterium]